jgi:hypothetical protein
LDAGRVRAIVSSETPQEHLSQFRRGGVIDAASGADADLQLARMLDELARRGGSCVVIEDAVMGPHDPALSLPGVPPSAFIGDHVVHWEAIQPPASAIATIYAGSSGYPTNAFVVAKSCAELGLAEGQDLDEAFAGEVARSLVGVLVAAYDAESFLVWEPDGA